MATNDADPRETAKARERQIDDGVFLGGDDFPANVAGTSDTDADPDPTDPLAADLGEDSTADSLPTTFEWPADVTVPERLKGKSVADVAKEFASLQTEFGRQTTELGETRTAIRDLVQEQLLNAQRPQAQAKPKEITFDQLESNPTESIRSIVQEALEEALEPVKASTKQSELQAKASNLATRFPAFQQDVTSQEFKDWVGASPYRQRIFQKANAYDFDAADELLSGYQEVKTLKAKAAEQQTDADKTASVRAKAGVKGGGGGSSTVKRGKVYRAVDIANLYTMDRERYNAMYPEFEKAWAEGRVK